MFVPDPLFNNPDSLVKYEEKILIRCMKIYRLDTLGLAWLGAAASASAYMMNSQQRQTDLCRISFGLISFIYLFISSFIFTNVLDCSTRKRKCNMI